ncbi:hypothetical protein N2152v2_004234 [Parachlorella kessleri]
MSPERLAFVLIDGIGDVTIPALGSRTPLQAATVPYLNAVAAAGFNGLMDPVEPGLACGSDTSHLSIFGYDPRHYYRGRGAFESMGAGLAMAPGDIAFKCNFATLDPVSGLVLRRRADRRFETLGPLLCAALDGLALPRFPQHAVSVKYATEHRCGVVVRGPGLSDAISGTDPLRDNLPLQVVRPLDDSPEAAHTAEVVNQLSAAIRQGHPVNKQRVAEGKPPANIVLLRGCGSRLAVQPFLERHGLRACMVAPTKIIAGLGMSLGLDVLEAEGATGDYRTLFHKKAEVIAKALTTGGYDFGFLHIKAVDDTGHDRLVDLKASAVRYEEVVDRMVGQLLRLLWQAERAGRGRYSLVVTGDHSTPVEFGDHSHEPVPFAIARVRDVVAALGGTTAIEAVPLEPIPHPHQQEPSSAAATAGVAAGALAASGSAAQHASAGPAEALEAHGGILPALAALQQQVALGTGQEKLAVGLDQRRNGCDGSSREPAQPSVASSASGASREGEALVMPPGVVPGARRHPLSLPDGAVSDRQGQAQPLEQPQRGKTESQSLGGAPPGAEPLSPALGLCGDGVQRFSEIDAAGGALGRFPGSQVMTLVKQFVGLEQPV